MRAWALLALLVAALFRPAPAHAAPPLKVVVIGSSTAAGKNLDDPAYGGAPGNLPWPSLYRNHLLATRPGSTLTNLAVAGTTTFEGMPTGTQNPSGYPAPDPAHNISAAIALRPHLVIVAYSLANGASTAQIMTNLNVIRQTAQLAGIPIWITTPIPLLPTEPAAILAQIRELRSAILSSYGSRALDFTRVLADSNGFAIPSLYLTDDEHPNQAGHLELSLVVVSAALAPPAPTGVPVPGLAAGLLALFLALTAFSLLRRRTAPSRPQPGWRGQYS